MTESSLRKNIHQETALYKDGTPSPYMKIICEDYATDLCFSDDCKNRSIGCAGTYDSGEANQK